MEMNDEMALLLILFAGFLYWVYRRSKSGGYASDIDLKPGTHRIGEDLAPGKGDLVAVKGGGDICILEHGTKNWSHNFKLHADSPAIPSCYRNLTLNAKDILEINGSVELRLTPAKAIEDGEGAEISLGTYQFGVDIPPAKYNLKATAGDGQIQFYEPRADCYSVYQDMNATGEGKSSVYENLLCESGSRLVVEGTLKLQLTKSKKQRGKMQAILDFLNQSP